MSWKQRLAELTLAGGMLGAGGCVPLFGGACGNANPDPCICGRPDASAVNAELCDSKRACEATGGSWERLPNDSDGGVHSSCTPADGGTPSDAGAPRDASGD